MLKKYFWIKPTKGIGSGKISRRVILFKKSSKENIKFRKSKKSKFPTSNVISKVGIKFTSPDARIIFYYWQRLGYPFVKHQEKQTKTTTKAIRLIEKNLKKYSKNQIINSMSTTQKLFNAKWFKFRILYGSKKISLPLFFEYDQNQFQKVFQKGIPKSWFLECRKPLGVLEEKYGVKKKIKHKNITKNLIDSWLKYSQDEEITNNQQNQIISASDKIHMFCKNNNLDTLMIVEVIDQMLNNWNTWRPKSISWMNSDIFIQETLPKELVRANIISKREKQELRFD